MVDPGRYRSDADSGEQREEPFTTRREWEEVASDPDLHANLEYEPLDLEAYETNEDRLLFLPPDEGMLRDEIFIIADKEDVCAFGE